MSLSRVRSIRYVDRRSGFRVGRWWSTHVVVVDLDLPQSNEKARGRAQGVVVRGALDWIPYACACQCYAVRTRTGPYVVTHAARPGHAIWPLSRAGAGSGSRSRSRPGRAAAAGELGVAVAVAGGQRGGCAVCVCVFRAWPLCVLATGVAADEFAGRGVVGSVSAAEPPRITDVSRLLSSPLSSRLPRYGQRSVCTYIPMVIWQQTPTPAEHCPAAFFPSLSLSLMGCACLTD